MYRNVIRKLSKAEALKYAEYDGVVKAALDLNIDMYVLDETDDGMDIMLVMLPNKKYKQ